MSDECHLCLLGLIALSSLLTGSSGEDDAHVFISSGENLRLSCNNALHDCNSTTWIYNNIFRHSAAVELIGLGIKKKHIESHERLSLGSDCSLNIRNISKEDYGSYICQQWTGENGQHQKQGTDACVYLHVLHVSSSQTEISAGRSVTLFCQLYSYAVVSCGDWIRSERIELFWVNQAGVKLTRSDSRYQISAPGHCISSLTTTLLNEDHNREWRCEVTQRDQVKTSVTYTVKSSAPAKATTTVTDSQHPSTTSTHKPTAPAKATTTVADSQHPSTTSTHETKVPVISAAAAAGFAVFLAAVLWLICRKRAGNKRGTGEPAVKDENEDKVTYETINMSIPAAARDNTDDVTYSEVSSSSKKPVKSLKDHDDLVTYAVIR